LKKTGKKDNNKRRKRRINIHDQRLEETSERRIKRKEKIIYEKVSVNVHYLLMLTKRSRHSNVRVQ
jgi:hypothetical protein